MNTNKITIITTIIALILIIGIPTIYKVVTSHDNHLQSVVNKKVIEKAEECYYSDKCENEKIYLKDLYALNMLEQVSNPITKEYYNESSYVLVKDNKFTFVVVD